MGLKVYIASKFEMEKAYAIVQEYYEAAAVVVREDAAQFAGEYFKDGSGIWLAEDDGLVVGCIALRELASSGQIPGMVKSSW